MIIIRVLLGDSCSTAIGPDGKSVRVRNPPLGTEPVKPVAAGDVVLAWLAEHMPEGCKSFEAAAGPSYGWWFVVKP